METKPVSFQHLAGLSAYYDTASHYFLHLTRDETAALSLRLMDGFTNEDFGLVALPPDNPVWLRATFMDHELQFHFSLDDSHWEKIGPTLESARLSDEWNGRLGFTGTMVGLAAIDLSGDGFHADFSHLHYNPFQ